MVYSHLCKVLRKVAVSNNLYDDWKEIIMVPLFLVILLICSLFYDAFSVSKTI